MSDLRKELEEKKLAEQRMIAEAAESWVQDNIVLISEKLNRNAVNKLTNSILKFDEKFGPYKSKLPEVQEIIDNAETGLQLVVTGKTSESRATDMLRKLSMIYTMLSEFFSSDLPALLRTPLFRAAKENPEMRLDSITAPGHNPKAISAAFSTALRPSKDELKMLGRVYKNIAMPNLKAESIAKQLLTMTFAELSDIAQMDKVPMVAVEKDSEPEASAVTDSAPLTEEEVIDEQKNQDSIAQVAEMLGQLTTLFNSVPELKASPLNNAVINLRKEAQKAISGGRLGAIMSQGLGAVFRNPEGKVLAQGQMAIELFKKLGQAWPKLAPLFSDDQFTAEEQESMTKILQKELDGGLLSQIKNVFKVPPFPGLSSADVINVVRNIAAQNAQTKATGTAVGTVQEGVLHEDLQDLESFFTKLNTSFKPQRTWFDNLTSKKGMGTTSGATGSGVGTKAPAPTTPTRATNPTTSAAKPGQPMETMPTQGTGPVSANADGASKLIELGPNTSDQQLKAITKATGVEEDRLRKLAQTRGVRVSVDPEFLKVK